MSNKKNEKVWIQVSEHGCSGYEGVGGARRLVSHPAGAARKVSRAYAESQIGVKLATFLDPKGITKAEAAVEAQAEADAAKAKAEADAKAKADAAKADAAKADAAKAEKNRRPTR